jgi:hypothetical protein
MPQPHHHVSGGFEPESLLTFPGGTFNIEQKFPVSPFKFRTKSQCDETTSKIVK